eukprot:19156_1
MTTKLPPLRAGNGFCEIDESERIFSHKGAKNHRYTYVIFPQAWCTGLRRLKFQCVAPRGVGYGVAIGVVSNLNANVKSTAFFFDEKEVGHSYNLWLGNKGTQTANAVQHRYKGGTWTNIDVSDNRKLKSGDIMEAEVDFDNRCIQFLINHEEVGSPLQIEQNIALYPAIAYCCKKSFNHEERGPPKYKLLTCGSAEEEKEAQRRAEKEKAARALEERERRERAEEEEAKRKHELEKMRLAALEQKRHDEARAHELKLATEQKQLQIDMEEKARALEMKREKERQALAKEREETMRKHALEMAEIEKAKKAQEEMALRAKEEADRQAAEAKAKAEADATRLAHEQAARMAEIAKADAAQREAAKLEMAKETARLAKEAKELHQKLEKERRELEATQEKERQEREEREAKAKREHDLAMRKQKAEEEKLKAEKAREIELANQKYEREMLDLKAKQEKETEERRQKAEKDKKEREEKARVRILEERQKRRDALREEMKTAEAEITTYNKLQAKTIMDLSKSEKDEEILNVALTLHKEKYDEDIAFIQQSINAAKSKYAEAHGKIRNAINQTNVDEGSIPQFLNLINDGLIVGTLHDTVKREELNAKLGAFGDLIERRTSSSLAIDTLFKNKLSPFVKYLAAEQFETMDDVLCEDEKELADIVQIIENGIKAENKEIKQHNDKLGALNEEINQKNTEVEKEVKAIEEEMKPIEETIAELLVQKAKEKDWDKVEASIAEIDKKIETCVKNIAQEKANAKEEDKEEAIAALQKKIDELNAQKAKEEEDGTKGKEIADKLSVQQKLKGLKEQRKNETLKKKKEPLKSRKPIPPIRTKPTRGCPRFTKIKKLCMRDLAEGKRGWITKLGDDPDTDVDIDIYFKGNLASFAKYLKDGDYETMEDLLCDPDEDGEDKFEEILDIIEAGIEQEEGKPLKRGSSRTESGAMRALKQMCLKKLAHAKGGWIEQQTQKKEIVTAQLTEVSPCLATFFGAMDVAVTTARKYLEYTAQNTPAQTLAIKNADENEKKLKAIGWESAQAITDEEEEETKDEYEDEDEDEGALAMERVYKDRERQLAKPPERLNEEQAGALELARKENNALRTAVVAEMHVVNALAPQFEGGTLPFTRKTGLTLARDVETCSLQIMESQATIRSSVLIARQLVEFKPAKPGKQAAPFWKVIDAGIVNIFNNYIEMMKIASIYFSYFVKFKAAFEYYVSCREIQKEDSDLMVATEYLQRDVKSFTAFKSKMQATVDKLTNDAKTIISDCVSKTSGAQSFKKAQEEREKATAELLRQQKDLNDKRFKLVTAFNAPHDAWKERAAELDRLKFVKQQRDEKIQFLTRHAENANEKLLEFSNAKQDDAKEEDDPEKDIKGAVVDDANSAAKGDAKQDDAEEEDDAKKDIKGAVVDDANSAAKGDAKQDDAEEEDDAKKDIKGAVVDDANS